MLFSLCPSEVPTVMEYLLILIVLGYLGDGIVANPKIDRSGDSPFTDKEDANDFLLSRKKRAITSAITSLWSTTSNEECRENCYLEELHENFNNWERSREYMKAYNCRSLYCPDGCTNTNTDYRRNTYLRVGCVVHGGWSGWTGYSSCTVTCGGGTMYKKRYCNSPYPANGGLPCSGSSTYSTSCNTLGCPINGNWATWTAWSKCSVTCGSGLIYRTRTCTNPAPSNGGLGCSAAIAGKYQSTSCSMGSCPVMVNGGWSAWTAWSKCPVTCGGGTIERIRTCTNPAPANGGSNCVGDKMESLSCNTIGCPINGNWADWSSWSKCAVSCGTGISYRTRTCTNPAPSNGGIGCSSAIAGKQQSTLCLMQPCPVDGGWGDWSGWDSCTKTCGGGMQERIRHCDSPVPANGGLFCSGSNTQEQPCNWSDCPIDGGWTDWSVWSKCTVTCGRGDMKRYRTCTNPAPQFGGKDCLGLAGEMDDCNTFDCPINGNWADWSAWSSCSVSCGQGLVYRTRTCTNPPPSNGGIGCSSAIAGKYESQTCDRPACPIDGGWDDWSAWSKCPVTCGGGIQDRIRTCTRPIPQYGGADCTGDKVMSQPCNWQDCPIDGMWGDWAPWTMCPVTCGGGIHQRMRACDNPPPQYGGAMCAGSPGEEQPCNQHNCPIDGGFTDWSVWDTCSVTCGGGIQGRSRSCTNPAPQYGGSNCVGDLNESQSCNIHNCPINGNWSAWTVWDTCSVSCGGGSQGRARTCTNPSPQHGGDDCTGADAEQQNCNTHNCPIDGNWSDWTVWDTCSVTCGGGSQGRSRTCTNPAPQYGGADCMGSDAEQQNCNTHNCPIDGNWSDWTVWDTCSVTCGGGSQGRLRTCTNPAPQYGGVDCTGNDAEQQDCNTHNCPIDGVWTDWSVWDTCSVTCGGGNQGRSRSCSNPAPQYGGADCAGDDAEQQDCNTQNCPIDGNWSDWTVWDTCPVSCGGGSQGRSRTCTNPAPQYGGAVCTGDDAEQQNCNTHNCPIDGSWTDWSVWDTCSVTCGGGSQGRSRSCANPAPQYGGADCVGDDVESQACNSQNCPIDGSWSDWSIWETCSVSCGGGSQSRIRNCSNPAPQYGGAACVGDAVEEQNCNSQNCPIDGSWSDWSVWDTCSVSCGGGSQSRTRNCSNPAPQYGGAACIGDSVEEQNCNSQNCPINGGWSDWSVWDSCSVTCGGGMQGRNRSCSNPMPQYGGDNCVGDILESQDCNTHNCPIDGGWSDWSAWDACPVTCGGGSHGRSRACTNPTPQYGGVDCVGDNAETQNCNTLNCPIDGNWGSWGTWGGCSATCGGGNQTRERSCTNPAPQFNGADCAGDGIEYLVCNTQPCPVDGEWSDWGAWGTCSVTCGGGQASRARTCSNPYPANGGAACVGDSSEFGVCNNDSCPTAAPGTYVNMCPSNGWFTCQNGTIKCIETSFTCDCNPDCEDASDEMPEYAGCDPTAAQACFAGWAGAPLSTQVSLTALLVVLLCAFFNVRGVMT